MKILKTQVLRGPNIWSIQYKSLMQIRVDLEDAQHYTNITELVEKIRNGFGPDTNKFFEESASGIEISGIIQHVALQLQAAANMDVSFGITKPTIEPGIHQIVFQYTDENAGQFTARAAVRIVGALIKGENYNIREEIEELINLCESNCLGPSTKSIVDEAIKRNIPWMRLSEDSLIQLGYGRNQARFQATTTSKTSLLAVNIAGNKEKTKQMLADAYLPVAEGGICTDERGLKQIIDDIGYPLVTKPLDGNHGRGITTNITNWEQALIGLQFAKESGRKVIVERFVTGFDFRVLVIDNKFVAATKRVPAHVIGDGKSTIKQLVDLVNRDGKRGNGHANMLTKITINSHSEELLKKLDYTIDSVPKADEIVYLKSTANLSTGGSAIDVTDSVHPDNIAVAETISRVIGLDICGIDIAASSLETPLRQNGGVVLEVNAAPGFRMHLAPTEGQPRNVAAPVVDMLIPAGTPSRIPIIAVTGTNGKTSTTRLLAHIIKTSGFKTGFTTTDGIYINDTLHEKGDTTGPVSAKYLLKDSSVEFAVLETARGGILRNGVAFEYCDVGVITNIKEDHLGLNDIHTLEELANVKSVVVRSVKQDGWAILNAEDEHSMRIASELNCNVAYFTMDPNGQQFNDLIASGNVVATLDHGTVVICKGTERVEIENVANIPITMQGKIRFMVANSLAASLAAYSWGISVENIKEGLQTFIPSAEAIPGRMNIFEFKDFRVMIDYAHNPHGFAAIEDFLTHIEAPKKIGIISGVGDRRDDDIREYARIAARMFDHIIIRTKLDLRGRTRDELIGLLVEGIESLDKNVTYEVVLEEQDAIRHAIRIAGKGDFVVALTDEISEILAVVKEMLDKENMQTSAMSI
ncbi:MAG TPA: cyanophycin synthetase [Flavobacterium sp.]|jgi:cyanophycin synthetase